MLAHHVLPQSPSLMNYGFYPWPISSPGLIHGSHDPGGASRPPEAARPAWVAASSQERSVQAGQWPGQARTASVRPCGSGSGRPGPNGKRRKSGRAAVPSQVKLESLMPSDCCMCPSPCRLQDAPSMDSLKLQLKYSNGRAHDEQGLGGRLRQIGIEEVPRPAASAWRGVVGEEVRRAPRGGGRGPRGPASAARPEDRMGPGKR